MSHAETLNLYKLESLKDLDTDRGDISTTAFQEIILDELEHKKIRLPNGEVSVLNMIRRLFGAPMRLDLTVPMQGDLKWERGDYKTLLYYIYRLICDSHGHHKIPTLLSSTFSNPAADTIYKIAQGKTEPYTNADELIYQMIMKEMHITSSIVPDSKTVAEVVANLIVASTSVRFIPKAATGPGAHHAASSSPGHTPGFSDYLSDKAKAAGHFLKAVGGGTLNGIKGLPGAVGRRVALAFNEIGRNTAQAVMLEFPLLKGLGPKSMAGDIEHSFHGASITAQQVTSMVGYFRHVVKAREDGWKEGVRAQELGDFQNITWQLEQVAMNVLATELGKIEDMDPKKIANLIAQQVRAPMLLADAQPHAIHHALMAIPMPRDPHEVAAQETKWNRLFDVARTAVYAVAGFETLEHIVGMDDDAPGNGGHGKATPPTGGGPDTGGHH